jgi:predicted alpha/beta hydrolase
MTSQPIQLVHRVESTGATIAVEEYGQNAPDHRATLVFLPALGVPISYYRPLFEHWADSGRHLFAVELRGGPQSPVTDLRRDSFGYSHLVRDDLPAVFGLEAVAAAADVVVIGHSLGGQIALLAAASGVVKASAVVTIATGTSSAASQRNRSARIRRQIGVRFVHAAVGVFGYWPGHRLGFGGRQPKLLMRDWAYEGRHGRYRLAGDPTDYEAALAALSPPTLLVALAGDPMMPRAGVDHLADRLPVEVERVQVDTGLARDHFLWARRQPAPVVTSIESWLAPLSL